MYSLHLSRFLFFNLVLSSLSIKNFILTNKYKRIYNFETLLFQVNQTRYIRYNKINANAIKYKYIFTYVMWHSSTNNVNNIDNMKKQIIMSLSFYCFFCVSLIFISFLWSHCFVCYLFVVTALHALHIGYV